jgi:hypothetical protein
MWFSLALWFLVVRGGVISSSKVENCLNDGSSPISCKQQILVTVSIPGVETPQTTQQVKRKEKNWIFLFD